MESLTHSGASTVAAIAKEPELCPLCQKEWPARFGPCPCNLRRVIAHKNAIILSPDQTFLEMLARITDRHEARAIESAEYADNAGEDDPYPQALREIDAAIGRLKHFRRDMQRLAGHAHRWNSDDYCSICGRDGRG